MTRPRIIFRADASHAIGLGHVARLCAVIEEAEAAGLQPIAMFGGDPALAPWIRSHGITADVRPWTPDELIAAALHPDTRAVVIDGPALATALIPGLAAHRIRTVLIDDHGHSALPVDTVINHNAHAPQLAATYPAAQHRLLGRSYLMLRRQIRRYTRGACRPSPRTRLRIVLSFGGSDPVGATARTLALLPPDRPSDVCAIAGPSFRDDPALQRAAATATTAGHTVELHRAPDDPARLFIAADAAICSAGGTLGELAYLGCPALGFAIVPDQVASARSQVRTGLISGGRIWSRLDDDAVRSQLLTFVLDDRFRHDQRQRALASVDGAGTRRIVAEALR
jgi:spore coat polysaccharide biosynthesis predicted glycosyltransferase SpsG